MKLKEIIMGKKKIKEEVLVEVKEVAPTQLDINNPEHGNLTHEEISQL